jgi:methionyl-tRNA synthetase
MKKFYLTTPLYYVNDVPHIGHAYTTIAADTLSRYKKLVGSKVFFLTGTDEHGQKVFHAAEQQKMKPQDFVDKIVEKFKETWKILNINYDFFIRTSSKEHKKVVQNVFEKLCNQEDIYKGEYEGWYCVHCESFWSEMQMVEDLEGRFHCPDCGRPTDTLKEESYFFKQSKYQKKLLEHIEKNPGFLQPVSRKNEVVNFIKKGLKDISVTRTAFPWGVPVPIDDKHVVYVWFDALINYISALGYPDGKDFKTFWPADVHIMGKEIVRFHAVTWCCMLLALNIPLPKKIFGHGWWTVEGKKMSKSVGNVVDPIKMVEQYGVDPFRYFILKEVPFGVDGDFSMKSFKQKFNSDLANDLGNLLHRTLTMIEKYFDGVIPEPQKQFDELSNSLVKEINALPGKIDKLMDKLAFSQALQEIWRLINIANTYIEKEAPWKINKAGDKVKLATFMYNLVETLKVVAIFVSPTIPETSKKMWQQLNFAIPLEKIDPSHFPFLGMKIAGTKIQKGNPIYPRLKD